MRKYEVIAVTKRDGYVLGANLRFFTLWGAWSQCRFLNIMRLGQGFHTWEYRVFKDGKQLEVNDV